MVEDYNFYSRLDELRRVVTERYLDYIFVHAPHFTMHGAEHSMAMESFLDEFLEVNNLELNPYEDFILRAGIWLHDIGMLKREVADEDPTEIRKNHHRRSQELIDSDKGKILFHLNPFESHIIGIISFYHRKSENIQSIVNWYDNCIAKTTYNKIDKSPIKFDIQIDKLAMLLRLLDTCDRSYKRSIEPEALELAKIPEAAKYHWAHYLISSITFKKNEIIVNSLVPPLIDGEKSKEENIINDLIIYDIRREIDSLESVLKIYNLGSLDVIHNSTRNGTTFIPSEISEEYLNYRESSLKEGQFTTGYINRYVEKTVCIYTNGHCIIDLVNDIIVVDEEGIDRISHGFFADEDSSPHDFKFHNFDMIKEVPITNRFNVQSLFACILNWSGENEHKITIIEDSKSIVDPFKYKRIHLDFSPKLQKDTRLKYGIGLSSPNFFIVDDSDKYLEESHFIHASTTSFIQSLKFEKGLVIKSLCFIITDINNKVLIEKELNITSKYIESTIIYDGKEGECRYSRENGLYYDTHKFNVNGPNINCVVKTKFKVDNMGRTS